MSLSLFLFLFLFFLLSCSPLPFSFLSFLPSWIYTAWQGSGVHVMASAHTTTATSWLLVDVDRPLEVVHTSTQERFMVRPCVFDCMHACVSGFDCACVREWALVFLFCTQKCSPCHVTTFFFSFFGWLGFRRCSKQTLHSMLQRSSTMLPRAPLCCTLAPWSLGTAALFASFDERDENHRQVLLALHACLLFVVWRPYDTRHMEE